MSHRLLLSADVLRNGAPLLFGRCVVSTTVEDVQELAYAPANLPADYVGLPLRRLHVLRAILLRLTRAAQVRFNGQTEGGIGLADNSVALIARGALQGASGALNVQLLSAVDDGQVTVLAGGDPPEAGAGAGYGGAGYGEGGYGE